MYTKVDYLFLLLMGVMTVANASPEEGGASSSGGDRVFDALEESKLKGEELRANQEQLENKLTEIDAAGADKEVEESLLALQRSLDKFTRINGLDIPNAEEVRRELEGNLSITPEQVIQIIVEISINFGEKTPLDKKTFFEALKEQSRMRPRFSSLEKAELNRLYKYYSEQWAKYKKASRKASS